MMNAWVTFWAQTELAQPISEIAGMGVVGFCFVLVLKWMLKTQSDSMKENSMAIHTNSLLLLQLQKELLRHDATVRGVNPSTGEDVDERMTRAIAVYEQMQLEIDRTSESIRKRMEILDRP